MLKHENSSEPGPDGKPLIKDPTDLASFDADAKAIRANAAKLFHSKTDEAEFMANYDMDTVVAKNKLQSIYMKKQIEMGQITTLEQSNKLGNLYAKTGEKKYLKYQEHLWKIAVERNQYGPKEAYREKIKAANKAKTDSFMYDLPNNPALVEKKLSTNEYGFDIQELENAGKIYEQQLKVIQNQTEESLIKMKLGGTLKRGTDGEDYIRGLVEIKKLDPKVAVSMIKDLNTVVAPKATALDKAEEFNKLVAKRDTLRRKESAWLGLGNADFKERTNYRASVFDAHRKGYITDQEMDRDFLSEDTAYKFTNDPKFQNAMEKIYTTTDQYMTREAKQIARADMSKALINKVMDGMAPEVALDEAVTEVQKAMNPNRAYCEEGKIYETPMGAAKCIGFDADGEPLMKLAK